MMLTRGKLKYCCEKPVPLSLCPPHIAWSGLGLNIGFHSERPAFQFVIRGCLSFHPYFSTQFYVLCNACGFSRGVLYIYIYIYICIQFAGILFNCHT